MTRRWHVCSHWWCSYPILNDNQLLTLISKRQVGIESWLRYFSSAGRVCGRCALLNVVFYGWAYLLIFATVQQRVNIGPIIHLLLLLLSSLSMEQTTLKAREFHDGGIWRNWTEINSNWFKNNETAFIFDQHHRKSSFWWIPFNFNPIRFIHLLFQWQLIFLFFLSKMSLSICWKVILLLLLLLLLLL